MEKESSELLSVLELLSQNTALIVLFLVVLGVSIVLIIWVIKIISNVIKNKNIKMGPIELSGQNSESPISSTQSDTEEEINNIYRKIHVNKIVSVTKACIEATINYINNTNKIFAQTIKSQMRKTEEITEEVVNTIKEQYSIILIKSHSEDPSYSIICEPDYSRLDHFLKRDFKISVDGRLRDVFNRERLNTKNDSEIDEISQNLSKAAIQSLKEQLSLYGLKNNAELLTIFSESEQKLKSAISSAIRKGKTISMESQKKLKEECLRHNSEVNRILQTSYDYEFNNVYIEEED